MKYTCLSQLFSPVDAANNEMLQIAEHWNGIITTGMDIYFIRSLFVIYG